MKYLIIGVVIRPPPQPPSSSEKLDVEEENEEMIGPPRPPQGTSDDGSDSDFDDMLPDDKLQIPLSNEIVLKGIQGSYNCLMTHIVREAAASCIEVWDLREMKNPIKVFDNIRNHYPQTNAAFSPDEQLIFTGTSVEKEDATGGMLCFYDRRKLELVSRVGVSPHQSVVRCTWHPKINQVFATVGDKKEGGTHILYDPSISQRGSLVCVARASRKKSVDDFEAQPIVHNPHALPLFRDQPSRKRQREKILKDPLKSYKPELPVTGPGFGGRVGATKGSLLTQYLMKQGGLIKETWMEEDPREAILKYADAAAKDPKFIAPAYAETQPKPVFAESDSDDEQK